MVFPTASGRSMAISACSGRNDARQQAMPIEPHRPITPAEAACLGVAAGFAATLLLSVLARSSPEIRAQPRIKAQAQPTEDSGPSGHAAAVTPAGALAQTQGPGPDGAAELFALQVGPVL